MYILILFIMRYMIFFLEIWLAYKLDHDEDRIWPERKAMLVSAIPLLLTAFIGGCRETAIEAVSSFFWGSMMAAAYSDWQIKKAYDYSFGIAFISVIPLMLMNEMPLGTCGMDLLIFILLQMILFRRMYGLADCMGFGICAAYFSAFGLTLLDHLYLMGVTFFILLLVQGMQHNLNKKGNLKSPVALLPYVLASSVLFYIWI